MIWRIASTGVLLIAVASTFLDFRPGIIDLVANHGGGQPDDVIVAQMRRWVMLKLDADCRSGRFYWHGAARASSARLMIL
jgi:hypothetical protein